MKPTRDSSLERAAEIERHEMNEARARERHLQTPQGQREAAFNRAIRQQDENLERMSDERAGELVRHMQAFYFGHNNGYQPGGPKHDRRLWEQVYKNAGERDPNARRYTSDSVYVKTIDGHEVRFTHYPRTGLWSWQVVSSSGAVLPGSGASESPERAERRARHALRQQRGAATWPPRRDPTEHKKMSTWNVFDAAGNVIGQLHGITRGYAEAVMFIKYHGDVSASKGVTYKGEWPEGTFEVSEVGDQKYEAFVRKKLGYFRQLEESDRQEARSRRRQSRRSLRRDRDPGKPDSRRKVHQHSSSYIRELQPRSQSPRGIERPIGAGYILAAYPYPFGRLPVGWHVYHSRNPNEWYAAGEAHSFDDAIDTADRQFGVDLRAYARDPRRAPRPIRPNARQRAFIAKKIPVLIREGYPQRQAIAIAYRMAGVPPLVRSSTTRTSRRKRPTRKSRRDVSRETRPWGHVRGGVRMCPCPEQRPPRMITFDPEDPFFGRDMDYRGQKTTVDWTKLTHMARMNKPGALAVLQDAIEIYFPKQFERAQIMARQDARKYGTEVFVFFRGRVARNRFKKSGAGIRSGGRQIKQHPRAIPFSQGNESLLREYGVMPGTAIVYSTKDEKNVSDDILRLQRRSVTSLKERKHARKKRRGEETTLLRALFPTA